MQRDILIEVLDGLVPLILVQGLAHGFTLLGVTLRVTGKHKVKALFSEDKGSSITPNDAEILLLLKDELDIRVRDQIDSRRNKRRAVVGVVRLPSQVLHDVSVFAGDCHGVVSVDGIGLEVVGEGTQTQLVEDTSLVDAEVESGLGVTPIGEVLGRVIKLHNVSLGLPKQPDEAYCVVSISTNEGHGIRQDRTRDSIRGGDSDTRSHGFLCLLRDDTWVKLHEVRVLI